MATTPEPRALNSADIQAAGGVAATTLQAALNDINHRIDTVSGASVSQIPFVSQIQFNVSAVMPRRQVSAVIPFTINATGAIPGASVSTSLVADGVNLPTFVGFKEHGSSSGYDNTLGALNRVLFWFDGLDYQYAISQDTTAVTLPRLSSAASGTGASTVVLTYAANLSGTFVPDPSAFALTNSGGIDAVSGVAVSGLTVTLTKTRVTSGETITVSYTPPATNPLQDANGNKAGGFSGYAVTVASLPGQVTGLTAGTPTANTIPLLWTAPSGTMTDYLTEYKQTSSSTWLTFADGVSTATTATINGLTPSTSYDVRVTAINAVGPGTPSSTLTVSTGAASASPGQVTGLTAGTPTSSSIPLSWTAPSGSLTDYITEYKLSSSGTWLTFNDGVSTATSTTITGLAASTAYDMRVSAVGPGGTGTVSATVSATTAAASTANYIRITTLGSNLTETANGSGWDYGSTTSAAYSTTTFGTSTKTLPAGADGYVEFTLTAVPTNNGPMIALKQPSTNGDYPTYDAAIYCTGSQANWQTVANGTPGGASSVPVAANDVARVTRAGTTITLSVSKDGGATFTTVRTITGASTAAMYVGIGNVSANSKVSLPRGSANVV